MDSTMFRPRMSSARSRSAGGPIEASRSATSSRRNTTDDLVVTEPLTVVGLGGSLARASRSLAALQVALDGAAAAGATTKLLDLRELDLPMYNPDDEREPPAAAATLIEACCEADGMLGSSPMCQGTISGAFKNALDWLHALGSREPPYLYDEVIGLISAAGGSQGLQAINTMEFAVRALRGWAVPYVIPVDSAFRVFDSAGRVTDEGIELQLRTLGAEVVRVATRFDHATPQRARECEESAERAAAAAALKDLERAATVVRRSAPTAGM